MSGQLHEVGSIVDFWPAPPHVEISMGAADSTPPAIVGVALVVVKRSTWIVTTELRTVRLVDGRYVVDQAGEPT